MNYINQLNNFFEIKIVNPISPNAQCLYINLFYINNKCSWKERFTVSNTLISVLSGIDRRTLDRARNELVQKGYIKYSKGTGNQAGTYLLVQFDTQYDTQCVTQSVTQIGTQLSHNVTTLDKQNKNKTKQNKTKEEKEEKRKEEKRKEEKRGSVDFVDIYSQECTRLPQIRTVTNSRIKAIGLFKKTYTLKDWEEVCKIANNCDFLARCKR